MLREAVWSWAVEAGYAPAAEGGLVRLLTAESGVRGLNAEEAVDAAAAAWAEVVV